jgi:uncharacterized protein (TIGR02145 family)
MMNHNISSCTLLIGFLIILTISCKKEEKAPDPVTDIEGNTYKTVIIGTQLWMSENLKTTRYNDKTDIPLVTDTTAWSNLSSPGYCWYNNDEQKYKKPFGALYNGYAVNSGKLCPAGWHVPDNTELELLRDFLGDTIYGGGKMKEPGTKNWNTPNYGADNSSGFTALGSGFRYFEGTFSAVLSYTGFWSSTEIITGEKWFLNLYYSDAVVNLNLASKTYGFSVRCIKD